MKDFINLYKGIARGKSITRSMLEVRLRKEFLRGSILDLGAGKRDMYSSFIPKENNASFELFDIKQNENKVDFETDILPYSSKKYDTVLLLNVLEHLFNYSNILKEIHRIKKDDGVLVGFVPFLMWYHPDHHDYFRYTHESLERILKDCGYSKVTVEVIHKGPYMVAFQMIYPTIPRFLRIILFPFIFAIDSSFVALRGGATKRYALGYYFRAV